MSQIQLPYQVINDLNGNPLENGSVYIGTANLNPETSPVSVYWDSALTQPAAQPLKVSNGYIVRNGTPAVVYISGSDCSLTVKDKTGSLVFSLMSGVLNTSQNITFIASGTGAVNRTLQSKLRDFVNVKDFGAVGDGVTDDTAAIKAAIAACSATVDGTLRGTSTLYFPTGTYLCTTQIGAMPCSCVGENRITTIIKYSGATTPFITFGDAQYTGLHFRYSNASLSGNFTEQQFPGVFVDCFWSGNNGVSSITNADCCISINKSLQVEFNKCHLTDAQHNVIGQVNPHIDGFANGATFSNCVFGNYVYGAIKNGGQGWAITGCIFEFSTVNDVKAIVTDGNSNWFGTLISGCWFGDNTSASSTSPYIQWSGSGLSVVGNYINGHGAKTATFMELSKATTGLLISGNYISDFGKLINYAATTSNVQIFGNNLNAIINADTGTPTAPYFLQATPTATARISLTDIDSTNITAATNLTGGNLRVGTSTTKSKAHVVGAMSYIDGGNIPATVYTSSTDALAAGTGAGIGFGGVYSSGGSVTIGAGINAYKMNATDSNYAFGLKFWTRQNGGSGRLSAYMEDAGHFTPGADNTQTLGSSSLRWSVVYAGTGTINTSDARQKQDISGLDDAEKRVAANLKGLIKKFRFKDAVQDKGDSARIHVGVIAQEVLAAFEAEGLDAMRYGIICYDEWEELPEITIPVLDENGKETGEMRVTQEHRPAGNRFGIRYEELLAFIIAAL